MSHEVEVGQVLDDRFHITDLISRSGMASIFKAKTCRPARSWRSRSRSCSSRAIRPSSAASNAKSRSGKTLNHPYILRILPVEEKSRPYIVMEFLQGRRCGR